MKKYSGVIKLTDNEFLAISGLRKKLGVSNSEMFRMIIQWGFSQNLSIPKQYAPYSLIDKCRSDNRNKRSHILGARLSDDMISKIDELCRRNGISESHLYRSFILRYLAIYLPEVVFEVPYESKKRKGNFSSLSFSFSDPKYSKTIRRSFSNSSLGKFQLAQFENTLTAEKFGDLIGLIILTASTLTRKP